MIFYEFKETYNILHNVIYLDYTSYFPVTFVADSTLPVDLG